MKTEQGVPCQNNHKSEQKQERVGGADVPQLHPECAQGKVRSIAAALSEKPEGLVKKSRRKE